MGKSAPWDSERHIFDWLFCVFVRLKVNDLCLVLIDAPPSPPVSLMWLVPQYPGAVVLPMQWRWNFLWWTNCDALSQCLCVCEIFARFCGPRQNCYIVGMLVSNSWLLDGCLIFVETFWAVCALYQSICSEANLLSQFAQGTLEVVFGLTGFWV